MIGTKGLSPTGAYRISHSVNYSIFFVGSDDKVRSGKPFYTLKFGKL
jgi:hypothetical protein